MAKRIYILKKLFSWAKCLILYSAVAIEEFSEVNDLENCLRVTWVIIELFVVG